MIYGTMISFIYNVNNIYLCFYEGNYERVGNSNILVGEDKLYIAEIPELKGFFADGKTRSEAIHNAEIVLAEWLEVAREDGIPIPKVKK